MEKVLVLNRKDIPHAWLGNKIALKVNISELEYLLPKIQWKDRDEAESDETVKQIIPYIITETDEDKKIAVYQRKGSEKRIHGLYSVGIGGHVNPEDFKQGDRFIDLILRSAKREIFEEFETVSPSKKIKFYGLINEELTKVGKTHVGLVFKLQIQSEGTASHELHNLQWLNKKEIIGNFKLEMWSEMALDLDINIFDFFKDLQLTKDQNKALSQLNNFIHSNKQVFILKGYAGTGKTTILKGLSEYLKKINRLGHIMAPTGRAAKVIEDITNYPATTIHRALYNLEKIKTYKTTDENGNETFKFYFDFRDESTDINKAYIFDESSMISNIFSEGEFFRFGSGFLLNDILKYFDVNTKINTKLIFVGDPAQLPPVGSVNSFALDENFFNNIGIRNESIELTEVIRQTEGSGLMENAEYYREQIFNEKVTENKLKTQYDDIEEISIDGLAHIFTSIAPLPDISKCIIITYSNTRAFFYNKIIRKQYFPNEINLVAGDILQIIKNNYSNNQVEFFNGDFVKVIETSKNTEIQSARIKKKEGQDIVIKHVFRDAKVQHSSGNIVNVKILDSLLNSKHRSLTSDEMKALYINFIMRFEKHIDRKADRNSEVFKEAFRSDPYFNAVQVKYGYAITGHKSQGGEWENTFIDFSGRIGTSIEILRWNYTAITRASKKMYVLHPPKLEQIDISKSKTIIGKINSLPKNAITYPEIDKTPYHNENTHPSKRLKYFEIENKIYELGYIIDSVHSNEFMEVYEIKAEGKMYTVRMNHKENGMFSFYSVDIKDEISKKILTKIKEITPWEYEYEYTSDIQLLQKLYDKVIAAKQGLNINILSIDDSKLENYHVNYYFRTKAEGAYIQFYFNKKERISNIIAKSTLGQEDKELKKLIANLKNNT